MAFAGIPSRRGFLAGLSAIIAAPAIVRASSLMPVRGIIQPIAPTFPWHAAGLHWHDLIEAQAEINRRRSLMLYYQEAA